jgi:hypothetical protein
MSFRVRAIAAILASLAPIQVRGEVIDRVLAIVGGAIILQSDVVLAETLGTVPEALRTHDADTLAQLIDRELVLAEVERYSPPEPEPAVLDAELHRLESRLSPAALARLLDRTGVTPADIRAIVRENLRIAAYVNGRFTAPPPRDAEVQRYLEEHRERFTREGASTLRDDVREAVAREIAAESRRAAIAEWVAGLRRRSDTITYPGAPPGA